VSLQRLLSPRTHWGTHPPATDRPGRRPRWHAVAGLSVLVPAFLVLPNGAHPAPAAHAVAPHVHTLALAGVDPAALHALRASSAGTGPAAGPAATPDVLTARQSTPAYAVLGVTWRPDTGRALPRLALQVRTHSGGTWSGWHGLQVDGDGPDRIAPAQRVGTSPYWAGRSDGLQVRVDVLRGALPRGLRADLIDPGTAPADGTHGVVPAGSAQAAAPQPPVISRAQWGADESIREKTTKYTSTVKVAFVHHTDTGNSYSPADSDAIVRGIYAYHVKSLGWSDIGYNFLVDKYGQIFEGRHGGITEAVLGAHTGGFNTDSMGVSAMGNFDKAYPTPALLHGLARVIAWKLHLFYRDPTGHAVLTSSGGPWGPHPEGEDVHFKVISGHRDADWTACPGGHLYAQLPEIRRQALAITGAGLTWPHASSYAVPAGGDASVTVHAGVLQQQSWTLSVTPLCSSAVLRTWSGTASPSAPISVSWQLRDAEGQPLPSGSYELHLASRSSTGTALAWSHAFLASNTAGPPPVRSGTPPQLGPGGYRALDPVRLLDTRSGTGTGGARFAMGDGGRLDLPVLGAGGVPASGVEAVALTVTAACPSAPGHLDVYPAGRVGNGTRTVSYQRGGPDRAQVIVPVGVDGRVSIHNAGGETPVVADVYGYVTTAAVGRYVPVRPARVYDSRTAGGRFAAGESRTLRITGTGAVPAGASAAVLNVSAYDEAGPGQVSVRPAGAADHQLAAVDYRPPAGRRTRVVSGLSADGHVTVRNVGTSAQLVLDVAGYLTPAAGNAYTPVRPARLLDTTKGVGADAAPLPGGGKVAFQVTGRDGVPSTARTVTLTLTARGPAHRTYLTAYASGSTRSPLADVLAPRRANTSNLVVVPVSPDGRVTVYASRGPVDVTADVLGFTG